MKFRLIENDKVLNSYFDTFGAANKAAKELLNINPDNSYIVILECKIFSSEQDKSELVGYGSIIEETILNFSNKETISNILEGKQNYISKCIEGELIPCNGKIDGQRYNGVLISKMTNEEIENSFQDLRG